MQLRERKVAPRARRAVAVTVMWMLEPKSSQRVWSGTVSIGVIEITRGEELESALKRVDLALYAAKHAGRNRVEAN